MSQIGNNIKKLRNVKGLSQQAFADLFGLTRGNISSYEERRAEPKIEIMLQIAKYFSIPIAELLEKQLTVNEILNFEDYFPVESVIVDAGSFAKIPYLDREYFRQYTAGDNTLENRAAIHLPVDSNNKFLAIENSSFVPHPAGFAFDEHMILFVEQVTVDILHTLNDHFGYFGGATPFFGRYEISGKEIALVLNDWKKEVYSAGNAAHFWKLFGKFERVL
ncbi:helix-turn-helix domain-containing protein [Sphingobacterium paludis]|uniref:Transcriptional regulator with XRE-family HTH domain n=1 Tax=Sphingobacterium paludis TaxID=1476465 RepID=A0A4R7CSX6_9SPHI|nr:helix-turn-helix transcriptional regulator [Sphingobacterium paludis]TDS10372.1 transcriptional regulator with XRE-family HTH domain [Sphingobacterium paludis]